VRIWRDLVPRDLLKDEPIVGFVLVEGLDDIIAKSPRVLAVAVEFVPAGIGIANYIEPVPRPTLAVVW
jgi:hypothetical protein